MINLKTLILLLSISTILFVTNLNYLNLYPRFHILGILKTNIIGFSLLRQNED